MSSAQPVTSPPLPFLVGGAWVAEGNSFEVRAPYDGSVIARVYQPTAAHAEAAIVAAVHAFETTRKLPSFERQRILRAMADGINSRKEDFARTIALEAGKPIRTARAEAERAIFTCTIAAEESTRIYGEYLPLDLQASTAGRWAMVRRFALGPVASISPFNFPLNLVAHKWAPAIAAACTVVHKPASQTPLSSLRFAELVRSAGWPEGALSVLPISGHEAEQLVTDDRLKKLTFTGSPEVGWNLKQKAGKKRVTLELGGNAGVIIHHDADLDFAAERCVAGGFAHAGQSCISVQRIFVQKAVYEKFLAALVPRVNSQKLGDPLDESTDVGPMISEADAVRVTEWIEEAVAAGAEVLCGGKRRGAMVEPTVLVNARRDLRVNCKEVFAPLVTVEPYEEFADAVREVNNSAYGLQAGVFTRDARLIFGAYDVLDVGGLIVGDVPTFRIDHMPYGGIKDSGLGREGIRFAIEEMTERKLLVMNLR